MGEMLTNMTVFESPPRESCRKYVSLELRYGTCLSLRASAAITSPNDDSDLLIDWASFSRSPVASVRDNRSEPACNVQRQRSSHAEREGDVEGEVVSARTRSTRCSFEQEPRPVCALWLSQRIVMTRCDRDEPAFIAVAPTAARRIVMTEQQQTSEQEHHITRERQRRTNSQWTVRSEQSDG